VSVVLACASDATDLGTLKAETAGLLLPPPNRQHSTPLGRDPDAADPLPGLTEASTSPIVLDMGSHLLDKTSPQGRSRSFAGSYVVGVRLAQVVTRQLAPRAARFLSIKSVRQVRVWRRCVGVPCAPDKRQCRGKAFQASRCVDHMSKT